MIKLILLSILSFAFCLSLSSQSYVSDTFVHGTLKDSITWDKTVKKNTYIEVFNSDSLVIIDECRYNILRSSIESDCLELKVIPSGNFVEDTFNIEVCDLEDKRTNITVSKRKNITLYVCWEFKICSN